MLRIVNRKITFNLIEKRGQKKLFVYSSSYLLVSLIITSGLMIPNSTPHLLLPAMLAPFRGDDSFSPGMRPESGSLLDAAVSLAASSLAVRVVCGV